MAYSSSELSLLAGSGAGGNGFRLYHYLTADTPLTVDTAGYFNNATNMLKVGDLILVVQVDSVSTPTSVTAMGWHIVLSNDGTTLDVSDATAIATTDLD